MWGRVPVLPLPCQSPEYLASLHTTPPTLHHTTAPHQGGTAGAGVATRQSSRQSVAMHRHSATLFKLDLRGATARAGEGVRKINMKSKCKAAKGWRGSDVSQSLQIVQDFLFIMGNISN